LVTASVTSGFAPAALSTGTAGVASAADGDVGEPGLFAALLSLLGSQPAPNGEAAMPASLSVPAVLPETTTTPLIDAIDLNNVEAAAQTEQGKSLLKNLGDALIAINDALDAGKPIDPALEKKLSDALDAVVAYLGTFVPPAPQIDPKITALASGEGILPTVQPEPPETPAVVTPAVATDPGSLAVEAAVPEDGAAEPIEPVPANAAIVAADDTSTDATSAITAAVPEAPPAAPAPLVKLGKLIEDLGNKLAAQSPELAAKLDTLAKSLKSNGVPVELIAELSGDSAADPEITRIIEALAAPRPATAKASAPMPFIAPLLVVPEAVAKSNKPGAIPEAPAVAELEAPEAATPRDPNSVRRTVVLHPETRAADPEPRPATAPLASAPQDPGATTAVPAPLLTTGAAAAARTIHAAYQTPLQQVNLPQVAFEVVRQFENGNSRFQIRLDPAELGRIDVRLDVDKSGTISARMTVERPETLDLLQRDQRSLQQALQQAGLDGAKTNLEFSLRQNPFAQQGGMGEGRGDQSGFNSRGEGFAASDDPAEAATTTYRGTASASGVNLFV
jgi:flagellar hook-length control protein FliK